MTLHWYCPPGFHFTYADYAEKGMGASESQALLLLMALAKRGHDCTCYQERPDRLEEGGVTFLPLTAYRPPDARDVLVWHRTPPDYDPALFATSKAGVKVAWNTDRWACGGIEATAEKWERYLYAPADLVLNFSRYAVDFTLHHYRVPEGKVVHFTHGVEWSHYQRADLAKHDGPPVFVYCSHPSRGLGYLMFLWTHGLAEATGGRVLVLTDTSLYGDAPQYEHFLRNHASFFGRDDVEFAGCVGHREVERQQRRATVQFYPTDMEETFCVAALECMAAGAVPCTSAIAALPETVGDCGVLVEGRPGGAGTRDYLDRYVATLLALCRDGVQRVELAARGRAKAASLDMAEVAARFEEVVEG